MNLKAYKVDSYCQGSMNEQVFKSNLNWFNLLWEGSFHLRIGQKQITRAYFPDDNCNADEFYL